MIKNNASSKLYIATTPTGADEAAKNFELICGAESIIYNYSINKVDKNYFCDGGITTSYITGLNENVSVSIDLDTSKAGHKYLYDLFLKEFTSANEQYFKIEFPLFGTETTPTKVSGKAAIMFKNGIPSGAANEIVKLEFDILPQEKWTKEAGK